MFSIGLPNLSIVRQTVKAPGALIFEDTFSGGAIDGSKWQTPFFNPGNGTLQWYQGGNVTVSGGNCLLTAKKEDTTQGGTTYHYTSGMINTDGIASWLYGYFEASIKIPAGQGFWPAFWMYPQNGSWPPEIDIMETIGTDVSHVYQTLWYGASQNVGSSYAPGVDFSAGFHTYAIDWTPNYVRWYVDGVLVFEQTSNIPATAMYLILNLAVGGSWPGTPDGTTVFPTSMLIDYVRVYKTY